MNRTALFDGNVLDPELPEQDELYDSIEEMPNDESPVTDGDDSMLAPGKVLPAEFQVIRFAAAMPKKAFVCPFTRVLRYNMMGDDVVAVKRGLGRVKQANGKPFMVWKGLDFTHRFNLLMQRKLKKFQSAGVVMFQGRRIVVPILPATGVYDKATHMKLRRFIDAYGRALLVRWQASHTPKTEDALLLQGVNVALYDIAHAWMIHYTQGPARMYGVRNAIMPPDVPLYEDCSSDATYLYWVPRLVRDGKMHRLPDPNGLNFNGWGFTGTMIPHGRVLSRNEPVRMGDLGFYGRSWNDITHVTYVLNTKLTSWDEASVSSHGGESGPGKRALKYRPDLQRVHRYVPIP